MEGSHFRLSDVTQPILNMHKQDNEFPAIRVNFVFICILIFLMKTVDFEKILFSAM